MESEEDQKFLHVVEAVCQTEALISATTLTKLCEGNLHCWHK